MLVVAAVLMSWLPQPTLRRRFAAAWDALTTLFPGRRRAGRSYQGFSQALVAQSPGVLKAVEAKLRHQMRNLLAPRWTIFGYEVFSVDGTRVRLPRTRDNEAAFGAGGRAGAMPQATLTTLLHMASGVTFDYRVGPADASERHHLRAMAHRLPVGALLVADAGFTGYDLLRQLIDAGRHVLIRAGAHVPLLRKLGFDVEEKQDTVYLWPGAARRRGDRPLVLRLIRVRDLKPRAKRRGRKSKSKPRCMSLLTDLSRAKLSTSQARAIYRRRWDSETFYRGLKQTMNRTKMLSRSPAQTALELRWTMVGLWMLRLWNAAALIDAGHDPLRGSVAQSLSVIENHLRHLHETPKRVRWRLWRELADARQDAYTRKKSKRSRDYPRQKQKETEPPTKPKLRNANRQERASARQIRSRIAQYR